MAERIDALETTVGETRSAFQAIKTVQTPLTVGPTVLDFDDEVFDQRDEYEPATGVFTARTAGRYQFFCTIGWHVDTHDRIGQYEAALRVNGDELTYNGHTSDGFFATRQVSAVFELEEGDEVQCASFQDLPDLTLNLASRFTRFEGGAF